MGRWWQDSRSECGYRVAGEITLSSELEPRRALVFCAYLRAKQVFLGRLTAKEDLGKR